MMNKYLTIFGSHSQYVEPEVKPNVSYCIQEDEVHYNPRTWADEYFTIESIGNNNRIYYTYDSLTGFRKTISISTDNGQTWTLITPFREINLRNESEDPAIPFATLNAGERVLIKGENSTYATNSDYHSFHASGNFEVKGNIMSLIYGDLFRTANVLTGTYTFKKLLNWSSYLNVGCVVSAENLILPATSLSNYCYDSMFLSCIDLIKAPELPATILANNCYQSMFWNCRSLTIAPILSAETLVTACYTQMFYGCTNLTSITCLATDISAANCTVNWVSGVAANGTFVKNVAAEWDVSGVNGIPTGWTVETATI